MLVWETTAQRMAAMESRMIIRENHRPDHDDPAAMESRMIIRENLDFPHPVVTALRAAMESRMIIRENHRPELVVPDDLVLAAMESRMIIRENLKNCAIRFTFACKVPQWSPG